jgi:hypothetical protein
MGASSDFRVYQEKKGKTGYTKQELITLFMKDVEQACYDHGHSGYTGTIAEATGLTVTSKVFASEQEAVDHIEETAEKWENALAVKVVNDKENKWIVGGIFSS